MLESIINQIHYDSTLSLKEQRISFQNALEAGLIKKLFLLKVQEAAMLGPEKNFSPDGFIIYDSEKLRIAAWNLNLDFYQRFLNQLKTSTSHAVIMNLGDTSIRAQKLVRRWDENGERCLQIESEFDFLPRSSFFQPKGTAVRFLSDSGLIVQVSEKQQTQTIEYYGHDDLKIIARFPNDPMLLSIKSVLKILEVFPSENHTDCLLELFRAKGSYIKLLVMQSMSMTDPNAYKRLLFLAANSDDALKDYAKEQIRHLTSSKE